MVRTQSSDLRCQTLSPKRNVEDKKAECNAISEKTENNEEDKYFTLIDCVEALKEKQERLNQLSQDQEDPNNII